MRSDPQGQRARERSRRGPTWPELGAARGTALAETAFHAAHRTRGKSLFSGALLSRNPGKLHAAALAEGPSALAVAAISAGEDGGACRRGPAGRGALLKVWERFELRGRRRREARRLEVRQERTDSVGFGSPMRGELGHRLHGRALALLQRRRLQASQRRRGDGGSSRLPEMPAADVAGVALDLRVFTQGADDHDVTLEARAPRGQREVPALPCRSRLEPRITRKFGGSMRRPGRSARSRARLLKTLRSAFRGREERVAKRSFRSHRGPRSGHR
jgi:hypothetical protein